MRGLGLVAVMLLGLLAGCTAPAEGDVASANVIEALSGGVDTGYARAYAPRPFEFPADHGAHPEYQTEWWYYTGNVTGADGDEFGYQLTFFRSAIAPAAPERTSDYATNQIYMAHFAVTDVAAGAHTPFELYSRGAGGLAGAQGTPTFAVWLEDWRAEEIEPGVMRLVATGAGAGGPIGIDLTLRETRPPVTHGNAGLSQKGPEPGNASYYYSLVGLETAGTIRRGDRETAVHGVSWMDHEFGTSALSENALGWDWFSVQLSNGAAIMFAQLRTNDGGRIGEFDGTLVWPDGRTESLAADAFALTVLDEWTSPTTGITYPSGWQVSMPAHALDLRVEPLIPNQEMTVSYVYWEGAVAATGTVAGESVTGQGYVELTGYGSTGEGYQR